MLKESVKRLRGGRAFGGQFIGEIQAIVSKCFARIGVSHAFGYQAWLILLIVFSLTMTVMMPIASYSQTQPRISEIRGVWLTNVDSQVLFDRDRLSQTLQTLKQLNFNVVYPTVWNAGYTLYPSTVAKQTFGQAIDPTPGLQGRDMLKEAVAEGHKQGMGVIPWLEFGFMAPANSDLAKLHPDWLTQRSDGSKIWKEGVEERVWLNPFLPQVQQFMLDLIAEIVTKYDIDGIQFDDHFSLPAEMGYDPYTIALYIKDNPGVTAADANPQETYWVRWRADKINEFMRRVSHAVKTRKPKCIISVSPNPLHFSLPAFLQDWFTWERENLIDELILQVYRNDLKRFNAELQRTEVKLAQSHIPVAIGIMTGLKGSPSPIEQIQTQVQAVRDRGFAGVSFFFYESLWNFGKEPVSERQSTFKKLFPTSAERPDVLDGWKPRI